MTDEKTEKGFAEAFKDDPATPAGAEAPEPEEKQGEAATDAQDLAPQETQEDVGTEEAQSETQQPDPAPQDEERIPIGQFKGFLEEREKRQQYESENARLKAQLEQFQQSQRKEETPPDIYDNPEGYRQHMEAQLENRLLSERVSVSEFMARQQHGDELVDKVKAWAQQLDTAHVSPLQNHPSPYMAAIDAYRREEASKTLKDYDYDIEKLVEARLAEKTKTQGEMPATPAGQTKPGQTTAKIPPKVANSGGVQADAPKQSDSDFFSSIFE